MKYQPYTYLIGWSRYDKWYYGCQYGKQANPKNLWKTYFTSSTYVNDFRKSYGEPDIIEIRKTFNNADKARIWEEKVIDKINAVYSDKWLNRQNKGKNFYCDEIVGKKISSILKGRPSHSKGKKVPPFSYEHRKKISINSSKARLGKKRGTYRKSNLPYETSACPYCDKVGRTGPMHRWHFNNCKYKND